MPIFKITEADLLENGVGNLPTRPSFPSLYAGQALSAAELRAAFDRLPTLLAEHINTLIDSLGLYSEETHESKLAALIATGIYEGHSLEKLFGDIKDGSLSTYLSTDGTRSLADALEALSLEIDALKMISVETVGEGDAVGDVTLEGNRLILHKTNTLSQAAAYTDEALKSKLDATALPPLIKRVETLESFASDTIYYYEYVEHFGSTFTPPDGAYGDALLYAFGGTQAIASSQSNLIPERAIPYLHGDLGGLSVAYDEENEAIVLNGTMKASDACLLHFFTPLDMPLYSFTLFYLDGTIETTDGTLPTVCACLEDGTRLCTLYVAQGNSSALTSATAHAGKYVSSIILSTTSETVFTDYRFHLTFKGGNSLPSHELASFVCPITRPAAIHVRARNRWAGETGAFGTTSLSFPSPRPIPAGDYTLSFELENGGLLPATFLVVLHFTDGTEQNAMVKRVLDARSEYAFTASSALSGFTVYAARTKEASEGKSLFVKEVMLEEGEESFGSYLPYKEDQTVEIPVSFRSYEEYGIGYGTDDFNIVDLVANTYQRSIKALTLEGEEAWQATDTAGVYSLDISAPAMTKNLVSSGLFYPRGKNVDHSVWISDGHLYLMCTEIASVEALKALLHAHPFRLVYRVSAQASSFPAEMVARGDTVLYLPFKRTDTVTVLSEDGSPAAAGYLCILYQIKAAV